MTAATASGTCQALAPGREAAFARQYNASCFRFEHTLHREGMFEIPRLIELSKRLKGAYFATSSPAIGDGWGGAERRRTLQETIATLAESNSLVLLKGLGDDPEYGPLFEGALAEIVERVGEGLRSDIAEARATLVMSSPGRVTPYHIDAEANFLLQLRGEKVVYVFDPSDRTLLCDAELEAFYSGDVSAAKYKKERQPDACAFEFAPGDGVHIPILAPHWVQNGDSVSVAISINCSLRSNERLAKLYRVNALLRRRGLTPASPGASAWRDRAKLAVAGGYALLKAAQRGGRGSAVSVPSVNDPGAS